MNRVREVFGVPRVLLPVIHPQGWIEALGAVEVAVEAGVAGVFVINQGMPVGRLLELVLEVRSRHPRLWVGINLLGESPVGALTRGLDACAGRLDGLWSDSAGVDDGPSTWGEAFVRARRERGWTGLYFGGTAFKYQREVAPGDLGRVAAAATGFMDVVCTSGPGTGMEADVSKVAAMREGIGTHGALALASGVTVENVARYLPYVDAFLVGTGIEERLGVFDPDRVRALQRLVAGV